MKGKEKLRKFWNRACLYYLYLPSILLLIALYIPNRTMKMALGVLAVVTALLDLLRYIYKRKTCGNPNKNR
ncbi:hypothetical protein [Clostridium sp. D33t1_170424_F3]|uniref:hypothetical protein n=1 Tax=Clostridium sp. D33t1_170424_F3 TaxID=2787099 RepID=UPI0018A99F12|nr:hypothetical protein [Clostridium sp. D33t1_170424_F3]